MADYTLTAEPPLAGYDQSFGAMRLMAPKDLALVSIALPLGKEKAATKAIEVGYSCAFPDVGKAQLTKDKRTAVMRLATDQAFVLFTRSEPDAADYVTEKIMNKAYVTDQTDVWSGLEISGPNCRTALERICPIDLHPNSFAVNDVARTAMEHLGVIILRKDQETYLLLSASSSAGSFLHAVETSLNNVS